MAQRFSTAHHWGAESTAPCLGSSPPSGRDTVLPHAGPPWGGCMKTQTSITEDTEVVGAQVVSKSHHRRRPRCKNISRTWKTRESRERQNETDSGMPLPVGTETCRASAAQENLENQPRLQKPKNRPALENQPCLQKPKNRPALEDLESLGLVRLYPRHRARRRHRKWWRHWDLSTTLPIFRRRSHREERRVLHAVWRVGVDEQDIGHLKHSYERMRCLRLGCDWLNSVIWVPHPYILQFSAFLLLRL